MYILIYRKEGVLPCSVQSLQPCHCLCQSECAPSCGAAAGKTPTVCEGPQRSFLGSFIFYSQVEHKVSVKTYRYYKHIFIISSTPYSCLNAFIFIVLEFCHSGGGNKFRPQRKLRVPECENCTITYANIFVVILKVNFNFKNIN